MEVMLKIYKECKYTSKEKPLVVKTEIDDFEIQKVNKNDMIKQGFQKCDLDENSEYLILHYAGSDEVGTYRNSHVDMFRI